MPNRTEVPSIRKSPSSNTDSVSHIPLEAQPNASAHHESPRNFLDPNGSSKTRSRRSQSTSELAPLPIQKYPNSPANPSHLKIVSKTEEPKEGVLSLSRVKRPKDREFIATSLPIASLEKRLIELLLVDQCTLLEMICQSNFVGDTAATVSKGVVHLLRKHDLEIAEMFLKKIVKHRVLEYLSKGRDINDIIRDNSMATMLLTAFARAEGSGYLISILSAPLNQVYSTLDQCEVDPSKIKVKSGGHRREESAVSATSGASSNSQKIASSLPPGFQNGYLADDSSSLQGTLTRATALAASYTPASELFHPVSMGVVEGQSLPLDPIQSQVFNGKMQLQQVCEVLFGYIFNSTEDIPMPIRRICTFLASTIDDYLMNGLPVDYNPRSRSPSMVLGVRPVIETKPSVLIPSGDLVPLSPLPVELFNLKAVVSDPTIAIPPLASPVLTIARSTDEVLESGLGSPSAASPILDSSNSGSTTSKLLRMLSLKRRKERPSVSGESTESKEEDNPDGTPSNRRRSRISHSKAQSFTTGDDKNRLSFVLNDGIVLISENTEVPEEKTSWMKRTIKSRSSAKDLKSEAGDDAVSPLKGGANVHKSPSFGTFGRVSVGSNKQISMLDASYSSIVSKTSVTLERPSIAQSSVSNSTGVLQSLNSGSVAALVPISKAGSLSNFGIGRTTGALSTTEKVVGSFLFLRFFVPAITSPDTNQITIEPLNGAKRRGLVLTGKMLTALCNDIEFGTKEDYLMSFNEYLKPYRTRMKEFLRFASSDAPFMPLEFSDDAIPIESPSLTRDKTIIKAKPVSKSANMLNEPKMVPHPPHSPRKISESGIYRKTAMSLSLPSLIDEPPKAVVNKLKNPGDIVTRSQENVNGAVSLPAASPLSAAPPEISEKKKERKGTTAPLKSGDSTPIVTRKKDGKTEEGDPELKALFQCLLKSIDKIEKDVEDGVGYLNVETGRHLIFNYQELRALLESGPYTTTTEPRTNTSQLANSRKKASWLSKVLKSTRQMFKRSDSDKEPSYFTRSVG